MAAAAAASVHMPKILNAVVKPNNNMHRNSRSGVIAKDGGDNAATGATVEATETTANKKTFTEGIENMAAVKCHTSEATVETTMSATTTTKTLPLLAADNAVIFNVNTSASGSENGPISVT